MEIMKRTLKITLVIAIALVAASLIAAGGIYWHAHATIRDGVATLKHAVTKDFNDPDSARFRSVELRSITGTIGVRLEEFDMKLLREHSFEYVKYLLTYDPEKFELCGEVNAKNAFGAYVGYKKFWINGLGGVEDATPFIATRDGDDFPEGMCAIGEDESVVYTEE